MVGAKKLLRVADHDFSKVSLIPDAVFVLDFPEPQDDKPADEYLHDDSKNSWFRGQVYYGVKNMVTQASTALRGVAEMGEILDLEGSQASRFFAITDGGRDRRTDYLFAQKSVIGLFLHHDMDEVLVCRSAAGLSYRNPVEIVHAITNLGLQSVGIMRQKMSADMEERIRNCNYNEELRKANERHEEIKPSLENSFPVDLLNAVFSKVSLKDKKFQTFSPCTDEELTNYHLPNDKFDENISELKKKEHLKNFPKFNEFLRAHTSRRTYYFHVFKCSTGDCPFHFPVRGKEKIESFGDPIPHNDDERNEHYHQGEHPEEKFIPSKLKSPSKRGDGIPFSPLAQTALNVGRIVTCTECHKPRLLYPRTKLKDGELRSLKRVLNDFQFVCGSVFQEIMLDKNKPDETVLSKVFARENISYKGPIELPYYPCKAFKQVCIQCGKTSKLIVDLQHYSQCERCKGIEKIKINKRKKIIESDLVANKKVKN